MCMGSVATDGRAGSLVLTVGSGTSVRRYDDAAGRSQ